jgi:hypothetical protein
MIICALGITQNTPFLSRELVYCAQIILIVCILYVYNKNTVVLITDVLLFRKEHNYTNIE